MSEKVRKWLIDIEYLAADDPDNGTGVAGYDAGFDGPDGVGVAGLHPTFEAALDEVVDLLKTTHKEHAGS